MANKYEILTALYSIVRDKPQPLACLVTTRELLLRLKGDWQPEYLEELVREELLVVLRESTGVVMRLTEKGWEKARLKLALRLPLL